MNESTVRTIIKDKVRIMQFVKSSVPVQSMIISKKRGIVIEEMEKLLVSLSQSFIFISRTSLVLIIL
jgi:hypothetical protein